MSTKLSIAIACAIITLICLFIAVERYQDNASNVQAMNQMSSGMLQGLQGGELKPATPAATTYALFFAVLAAAGALTAFIMHRQDLAKQAAVRPSRAGRRPAPERRANVQDQPPLE